MDDLFYKGRMSAQAEADEASFFHLIRFMQTSLDYP
jgi:hypothetical protein